METAEEGGGSGARHGPRVWADEDGGGDDFDGFGGDVVEEEVGGEPFFEEADGWGEGGEAGAEGAEGVGVWWEGEGAFVDV